MDIEKQLPIAMRKIIKTNRIVRVFQFLLSAVAFIKSNDSADQFISLHQLGE